MQIMFYSLNYCLERSLRHHTREKRLSILTENGCSKSLSCKTEYVMMSYFMMELSLNVNLAVYIYYKNKLTW